MSVGIVTQLWRYPVKSMAGEQLSAAEIDQNGVAGDRGWAVREIEADVTRNAREMPKLLQFASAYAESPSFDQRSPAVTITTPDNVQVQSADENRDQQLSEILGRPVMLTPLHPADDLAWYARAQIPEGVDPMQALRQLMGMQEDDPLPDFSGLPPDLQNFSSPPGTYFDCYPIHIMTTSSLNTLAEAGGGEDVDVRRFRPNVLIDTGDTEGLLEVDWTGKKLRLGEVVIELQTTTVRCSVPAHAQRDFGSSRAVGRALIENTKQHLGSYCNVLQGGTVNVGADVELID
ncbi:MAG: MOSC N-terminal beta barrel domain-containing protein [Chloroflexi bacterium]|nr:MOSC N-terminal beta barrel domain-containing protein [Chloroflexota bacterium]MCY3589224.1 MOSC N-terminal beta barrel domain-containing protein [Chloroflexota bacterium]MCY3687297.1 MOSC N-terminal beta barrel domain-containing protein [Chloroflexota bacterium]MDE2709530.1 MOSC N-terminal beta barrel domain-containing protein [Chloroflexota bacterium]